MHGRLLGANSGGDRFLAHRGLIAVSCGTAMAEACLLALFAPSARALAPQVTALPPLAVFHDLRWLYSAQRSWLWFALLLAALLVARSALNTVLVRLAWPRRLPPPDLAALGGALVVTALACLLISPLVSLTFGVAILPFSWPFLAMLPAMLLIALPLSHAGVATAWWRTFPPVSAVWWLLAEFAVLSAAAAAVSALPSLDAIPVAGLAGLINARAWYGLTAAITRHVPAGRLRPSPAGVPVGPAPLPPGGGMAGAAPLPPGGGMAGAAPLPQAGGMAGLAPLPQAGGMASLAPLPQAGGTTGPAPLSHTRGTTGPLPLPVVRATAELPPLGRAAAGAGPLVSLPAGPLALAAVIAAVIALTRLMFVLGGPIATGRPEAIVGGATGTSSRPHHALAASARHDPVLEIAGFGSWCCGQDRSLARALPGTLVEQFSYLGTDRRGAPLPYGGKASNLPLPLLGDRITAQVRRLHAETGRPVDIVAESEGTLGVDAMLARHPGAPVGAVVLLSPIIAPGQAGYRGGNGSALVTRDELHAVIWFVGGLSPYGSSGAQTLINSVNSVGARFADAAAEHAPVRLLEVVPLADAVTLPACPLPPSVVVVPAFHGNLLGDPAALGTVRGFLSGRPVKTVPGLRTTAEIVAAAATAWRMPQTAAPPSPPCGP